MLRTLVCCLIKSSHHFTAMRQELLLTCYTFRVGEHGWDKQRWFFWTLQGSRRGLTLATLFLTYSG